MQAHDSGNSPLARFAVDEWRRFWTSVNRNTGTYVDSDLRLMEVSHLDVEYHVEWNPQDRPTLSVRGESGVALLHGVYDAIHRILGVEFTLAEDVLPEQAPDWRNPMTWNAMPPRASIRGTLPWFNFLCGPSYWRREDFFAYIDQLVKLNWNFVGFHVYTGGLNRYYDYVEPFIPYRYLGTLPDGRIDSNGTARWGYARRALREFWPQSREAFGDSTEVSAPWACGGTREERYDRAVTLMREVMRYAKDRGVRVCIGFEPGIAPPEVVSLLRPDELLPNGTLDPTAPEVVRWHHVVLESLLQTYPEADYVWLWQHEHAMGTHHMPGPRNPEYARQSRELLPEFDYLSVSERRYDGAWAALTFRMAFEIVHDLRPDVGVVLAGWGNANQLPDLLPGLDHILPQRVIFSCLTPDFGRGQAPKELLKASHERWVIHWIEGDHALWHPQPRVRHLAAEAERAAAAGVVGQIAIHWRVREVAVNAQALARAYRGEPADVDACYRAVWGGDDATAGLASRWAEWDTENLLDGIASEEYFSYRPDTWGRLAPDQREALGGALRDAHDAIAKSSAEEKTRAKGLIAYLEFILALDRLSARLDELNTSEAFDPDQLLSYVNNLQDAWLRYLATAPNALARRGNLGQIASMNLRILPYVESLMPSPAAEADPSGR